MKLTNLIPSLLLALLPLVFASCGPHGERAIEAPSEPTEVRLFEKGKGLRLPDDMQRWLGVETVEVTERPIEWRVEKAAHVIRPAGASQPAQAIVWLNEADAAQLSIGHSVSLKSSGTALFSGTVTQVAPGLTNLLGQNEVLIEFPDTQRRAPAGSLLTAIFAGTKSVAVTAVPASAIVRGVEGAFVYTVSGSHYVRTPLTLGAESDAWVEVKDGLYAGDIVVARAVDALWTIELCALKGGTPCCPVGRKPGRRDGD